ncbi:MAG TPA: oxidoreductase, partial [Lachnospiraceae bacterium]|nr:oxidoreductase [Lachnospiraceae bacterium]
CIGAYMTEAKKDVTMIARGAHLKAMQKDGLRMETTKKGNYIIKPVKASTMEQYEEHPDVIFVCVKGYSLEETVPFIRRVAKPETIVIPILNLYGTGGKLQEKLPGLLVTDGCIYIAAEIKEPGCLWQNGDIFRVVFGVRNPSEYRAELAQIKKDLDDSGITGILSDHIQRDALQKFSYVSPAAACGQYYDAMAGEMQKPGEIRDMFASLIHEIDLLAAAMGIHFEVDLVKTNLEILDSLTAEASTSMQRGVKKGKASEMDGLIFEVVRLGRRYGVALPVYEKVAEELKRRGF